MGCVDGSPDAPAAAAEQRVAQGILDGYDFENRIRYGDLPGRLDEISGLAFTADGRLFAHDDERARVHELAPGDGEVGKRFDLGDDLVRGDFEGITIVDERFFLVTSTGLLYEFREGGDRETVAFRLTDTGLGATCEIEGLDYDAVDDALVFACKTVAPEPGEVVVHRLSMSPGVALPELRVRRDDLAGAGAPRSFAPSGVVVTSESYVLLSGRDDAIVEVDRRGRVLATVDLRAGRHPQSEGIEIGPDGLLYIADEKNGKEPRLTVYGPPNRDPTR